jgi:hypothetical protein
MLSGRKVRTFRRILLPHFQGKRLGQQVPTKRCYISNRYDVTSYNIFIFSIVIILDFKWKENVRKKGNKKAVYTERKK